MLHADNFTQWGNYNMPLERMLNEDVCIYVDQSFAMRERFPLFHHASERECCAHVVIIARTDVQ